MKKRVAAVLLLFLPAVVHAQGLTPELIAHQPSLWPQEVTLTTAVPTPLVINGKTVGTAELPAGTKLPVIKVERERVVLKFGDSTIVVAHENTDLLARVRQSQAALERAYAATPAMASPVAPVVKAAPAAPRGVIATELAGDLVRFDGKSVTRFSDAELAKVKYFGIYFSASWCGPCRAFTPKLVSFYNKIKPQHPEFEVVFVSRDRSERDAEKYMENDAMPWPAVRFSALRNKAKLNGLAGRGIPCLVLVDQDGTVLSHSYEGETYVGPQKVMRDIEATLAKR